MNCVFIIILNSMFNLSITLLNFNVENINIRLLHLNLTSFNNIPQLMSNICTLSAFCKLIRCFQHLNYIAGGCIIEYFWLVTIIGKHLRSEKSQKNIIIKIKEQWIIHLVVTHHSAKV